MINLITDAWIPARTRSGEIRNIRPAEVVDSNLSALAFPRADFDGAVTEFLIGLLSTAAAPPDEASWRALWTGRPSAADLDAKLAPMSQAFDLSHFMQTEIVGEAVPVERLMIDASGEKNAEEGRDMLNRSGTITALSPAMASAALITLQSCATEGGSAEVGGRRIGYYTSIRGGGPLTTLVASGSDLWGRLWPNVETQEQIAARAVAPMSDELSSIFPWQRGNDGATITPNNAHPLIVYWTTPRQIQLTFTPANGETCSLTGVRPEMLVRSYHRQAGGVRFEGWHHPLSPYYRDQEQWRPVRGRPERIGFRHWLGLVQSTTDDKSRPAMALSHCRVHRWQIRDPRLVAHGFAAKSATINGWQSGEMPLVLAEPDIRIELERTAGQMVVAADKASSHLASAIKSCRVPHWQAVARFWMALEPVFLSTLTEVPNLAQLDADDPTRPLREAWLVSLRRAAYEAFDGACLIDRDPPGTVRARFKLAQKLRGYGRGGAELYGALEIPVPNGGKA